MSRQGLIGHEKRLVGGYVIETGQFHGLEKVTVSLAAQELQLVVFIQAIIPCSWWELLKKNQEVDTPAVGVVPAELFAVGCCGCKKFI